LPSSTEVKLVMEAIGTWYAQPNTTDSPTLLIIVLVAAIGAAIIIGSIFAYKKIQVSETKLR